VKYPPVILHSLLFILSCACLTSPCVGIEKIKLIACYRASAGKSEVLGSARELIRQSKEQLFQSINGMLPTLVGNASIFTQPGAGAGDVGSSISPATTPLVKLTLTQPLFRGFRDSATVSQNRRLLDAQNQLLYQEMADLHIEVAQNFYAILMIETDIIDISSEIDLYAKRIKELKDRVAIGQSRINDVLSTQSAIANLRAQRTQLNGQREIARSRFNFLTGLDSQTPLEGLSPNTPLNLVPKIGPLDFYLSTIPDRPDVKSATLQHWAAQESLNIAKGATQPSIDLTGNCYFVRNGVNENIPWDLLLGASIPFFNGDILQSKINEAQSIERDYALRLQRVIRTADSQIRTLYRAVTQGQDQFRALDDVRKIAEHAYTIQVRDGRVGLVSNLDVMMALSTYQESIRAVDRSYFTLQLDLEKLNIAAGKAGIPGD